MALHKQEKAEIIKRFQKKELDTGSSEVQIALLSYRIAGLTEHSKKNKQDVHSRLGLIKLVNQRRRLLSYLKKTNLDGYHKIVSDLGLRK